MIESGDGAPQSPGSERSRTATDGAAPPVSRSGAAALAQRLGVGSYDLEVVEAVDLAPSLRRLRVGGSPGAPLTGFSFEPGQDLMLDVAQAGDRMVRRRYTIRRFEAGRCLLDLDFVLHGEGPAARWAAQAGPGTRFAAIGPRGKVTLRADATWHLFVGDETFGPAVGAMLDALGPDHRAVVVLEVDSSTVAGAFRAEMAAGDEIAVRFLERKGASATAAELLDALDSVDIPPGSRHAYVAGEHRVVGEIRAALITRGLTGDEVSAKPYWRAGRANADHGEPERDP
jgi:NADPH-dependent ferric siderophore reductase